MPDRFIEKSRALLLDECLPKLRVATEALSEDDTWWRPDPGSNSIGNLLAHLDGNARQWIISGVGQRPDVRDRAAEFALTGGVTRSALLDRLTATFLEIDAILATLTSDDLDAPRRIQGADTTVFEAIMQVVTHVHLHMGQIIMIAKWRAPGTVKLYEASTTGFTRLWEPTPRPR